MIFCFKNKFLNFSEAKKFSTESFLTFRELQPLVPYKRVFGTVKAGANKSNISSNITFLPCWMKCWNGLRNYKIYKVSKKKKKIILDDVG